MSCLRRTGWNAAALLLAAVLLGAVTVRAAPSPAPVELVVAGMPLDEALRALRAHGLKVVFSSGLVTADMRVLAAPRARAPDDLLLEVLAPHGLTVERGFGGRRLVVPLPERLAPATAGEPRRTIAESITVRATAQQLWDPASGARSLERTTEPLVVDTGSPTNYALALLPGTAGSDVLAPIHLRGAHVDEVTVLIDGVEVRPAFRLAGLQSAVGLLDEAVVQRLDVFAGGYPAEYGGRLGGVLSLSPAAPAAEQLEVGVGSFGLRAFGAGRAGERTGWMVALRGGDLGHLFNASGTAYERLEPEYSDAFAGVDRELGERGSLRGRVFLADDRLRLELRDPVATGGHPPDDGHEPQPGPVPAALASDERDRQVHAWIGLDLAATSNLASHSLVAYGSGRREREATHVPMRLAPAPPSENRHRREQDQERAELQQEWSWLATPRLSARGGLRVAREEVTQRLLQGRAQAGTVVADEEGRAASARDTIYELYASGRLDLGRGRLLELGARWDRRSLAGSQWSPRLNVAWPIAGGMARFAAGRVTQAPRWAELDLVTPAAGSDDDAEAEEGGADGEEDVVLAEPPPGVELDAQVADQLVVGYERRIGGTLVQLEAYRYDIRKPWPRLVQLTGSADVPSPGPALSGGARDLVSVQPTAARMLGLELLLRTRFTPEIDGLVSYSLAEATDRIAAVEVPRAWDQRHTVDALLAWRPNERWRVDLGWFYHSGWPSTEPENVVFVNEQGYTVLIAGMGPLNGARNPVYHRLDLGIARSVPVRRGVLEIELGVINAYDRENVCCVDRFSSSVAADLTPATQRFDLYWLPRTPTLSATWRF